MMNKVEEFARLLENDQLEELHKKNLTADVNVLNCKVTVKPKRKYICVDVGTSGKYMIDKTTEEIFGIRGYGKVNKSHRYGTLDTIYNYYWGLYNAIPSKQDRRPFITELLDAESILNNKGVYVDENGRFYGGKYGEKKQPEQKPIKVFKGDKYQELTSDLKIAKQMAEESALFVADSGTCNLDALFIRLDRWNEDKTIEAINNAGLSGFKTDHQYFGTGYYIGINTGQARKREVAAKTMYDYMGGLGYDVTHWQQMD
jgi:hypothetical protein